MFNEITHVLWFQSIILLHVFSVFYQFFFHSCFILNELFLYSLYNFHLECQEYTMRKRQCGLFHQRLLKKVDIHKQKDEIVPQPYIINKSKLKMEWIKDFTIRPRRVKFLEQNIKKNFLTLVLGIISWIRHQKHKQQ